MHADLALLTALAVHDVKLRRLDAAIAKAEKRREDARAAEASAKSELASIAAQQAENKTTEHTLQRKIHLYRDRRQSAIRVLESGVGDPSAAERQVENCDTILDDTETALLECLETQDDLKTRNTAASATLTAAEQQRATVEQAVGAELAALRAERAQVQSERDQAFGALDREYKPKYENLFKRKQSAVAPIYREACSACLIVVQRQEVADLKRDLIKTCRGCHRWLVLEEDWPLPLGR